jgi:hypothetical protein
MDLEDRFWVGDINLEAGGKHRRSWQMKGKFWKETFAV